MQLKYHENRTKKKCVGKKKKWVESHNLNSRWASDRARSGALNSTTGNLSLSLSYTACNMWLYFEDRLLKQ